MYKLNAVRLAVGLGLCAWAMPAAAQPRPGKGKERVSRPGQAQSGAKRVRTVKRLPSMGTANKLQRVKGIAPKTAMRAPAAVLNKTLKTPKLVRPNVASKVKASGKLGAMPGKPTGAAKLALGRGGQQRTSSTAQLKKSTQRDSHLHLVLEVSSSGKTKVLSAVRRPGRSKRSGEALGDFIQEVRFAGRATAVDAVQDPFELRAFPPPGKPDQGHHFERAKTAVIRTKVPNAGAVEKRLDRLELRLYKLKKGPQVQTIELKTLENLRRKGRLQSVMTLKGAQLRPQIMQQLRAPPPKLRLDRP